MKPSKIQLTGEHPDCVIVGKVYDVVYTAYENIIMFIVDENGRDYITDSSECKIIEWKEG